MDICEVQNIEAMFTRRVYFLYGKKSAVVRAVSQKHMVRNSVNEGKEMENDFLNTTKSNVNLKNYTDINLF